MLNCQSNNKLFFHERKHIVLLSLITAMFLLVSAAYADFYDSFYLLKISPQDERAVVKMEDGAMKIIKPGDAIGNNGKVIEITSGRVVIEELTDGDKETVIIRLEDGKQSIERMRKTPDRRPEILKVQ